MNKNLKPQVDIQIASQNIVNSHIMAHNNFFKSLIKVRKQMYEISLNAFSLARTVSLYNFINILLLYFACRIG